VSCGIGSDLFWCNVSELVGITTEKNGYN
jgi:hypothetical protein